MPLSRSEPHNGQRPLKGGRWGDLSGSYPYPSPDCPGTGSYPAGFSLAHDGTACR
jgi:hypothetical protein